MIDKAKTLDECFKELILKRGWSKNSPYDRRTASRHKKQFLEGTLPDEFKRVYLQSAGYSSYEFFRLISDTGNAVSDYAYRVYFWKEGAGR